MARPRKRGLDYFPVDNDIFNDEKIFELNNEFGPLGEAVYFRILCLIYRSGYYYRFQSLDKLALMILKSIGNRWCRDKNLILQIIPFLAECNLLSAELMRENVLTSAGIQRRYLIVARRRSETIEEYNLLGNDEGLIGVPERAVSVPETPVSEAENGVSAGRTAPKQRKEKQRKEKQSEPSGEAGTTAAAAPEAFLHLIEDNLCPVTGLIRDELAQWLTRMEPACVEYAVREAGRSGARTFSYVCAILQRLLDEGITSRTQLERARPGRRTEKMTFEHNDSVYARYFEGEDL